MREPTESPGSTSRVLRRSTAERRLHGRLNCELVLSGKAGSQKAPVRALDLSVSGARVVLPPEFRNIREIVLSGQGLRANSTVRAQVVWIRPEGEELIAGLHFLEDAAHLESTWAHLYLRKNSPSGRTRRHVSHICSRSIHLHSPGKKSAVRAEIVRLSTSGGQVDTATYLHLGSNLRIEIPYDEDRRHLCLMAQVVHQERRGRNWRISLQFLLADDAREHVVLKRILAEPSASAPCAEPSQPHLWL